MIEKEADIIENCESDSSFESKDSSIRFDGDSDENEDQEDKEEDFMICGPEEKIIFL